jgi:ceramide synthetase
MTGRDFYFPEPNPWYLFPSVEDFSIIAGIAFIITIARVYAQRASLNLAKRWNVKEANKFSESCWKTLYYISSTSAGLAFVATCDFFPETANAWRNWPNMPMSPALRFFELYQLGFYWHSLYAHFVYEVKRSDYWPLLLHHIATIMLIQFSYQLNFHRIGLLIVVAHDINDIFLETGKIFVYLQKERITNIIFVFLLISWVTTRLGIYPFILMYSAIFESITLIPYDIAPVWAPLNVFLLFLLVLHIYWFGLMLRMAARVIRGKEKKIVDSREQEEKPIPTDALKALPPTTPNEGDSPVIETKTQEKKRN